MVILSVLVYCIGKGNIRNAYYYLCIHDMAYLLYNTQCYLSSLKIQPSRVNFAMGI